jgi:isocitrate dehydrogenase
MRATLRVLEAAGAPLAYRPVDIGLSVYERGISSGITPEAWQILRETPVLLKAPITTPQGGGVKSLNVTIRKALGLYANVRPCRGYAPYIETRHPAMDLVIIRENEEDLYAGIEHRQTRQVTQCLKLITRPGCERVIRYAFEYAAARGRRRITCMTKDNIMKMTDGLFHRVFDEIAAEYPRIQTDHMIIDIGMARVADTPERFDVIVLPNLYGDILSDIAAQVSGAVGLAGSANIGEHGAMFEAVHGSAPDIAGRDVANPSGLLLSAVKMLAHVGEGEVAERIHNAWLATIESGVLTQDVKSHLDDVRRVGTQAFADEVIARLGERPERLKPTHYRHVRIETKPARLSAEVKALVGVDVFLDWSGGTAEALAAQLQEISGAAFSLELITNRGVKVWPEGMDETYCVDHWRCRFMGAGEASLSHGEVVELLGQIARRGLDFIKTEHLYTFDGEPGFSLGQGQ